MGSAFILACVGCGLAIPELMKDGTFLTDWSSPATWVSGLSFLGSLLGAVTGIRSLTEKGKEPLDRRETERALGAAMFKEGVATKADLNALAERLVAGRAPEAEAPPIEQLAAALDGLARSGIAAKTEAFTLIEQNRTDEGLAQLQAFARRQSEVLGQAAEETAKTWRQIGTLLLTRNVSQAAEAFEKAVVAAPSDRWTLVELCRLYLNSLGKPGAAEHLLPLLHASTKDEYEKALALEIEGGILRAKGDLPASLDRHEESLRLFRDLDDDDLPPGQRQRELSVTLENTGNLLRDQGRLSDALDRYEESLGISRTLWEDDRDNTDRKRDLAIGLGRTGRILRELKRSPEALDRFNEALTLFRSLNNSHPAAAQYRRDLSVALNNAGDLLVNEGHISEALAYAEESLALCRQLANNDPSHAEHQRDLSISMERTGDVLEAMNRITDALAMYGESLPIVEALAAASPDNAQFQNDLKVTRTRISELKTKQI